MESAINTIINGYPVIVNDASLKLYYDADSSNTLQPEIPGTGDIWKDISGNSNHGIIDNANYVSTSPQYFNFNGNNAVVGSSSSITHGTDPITYECWVRTADGYSPSDYESLMSTYSSNPGINVGFWIQLNPTNTYVSAGNDGSIFHVSSTAVNDGNWHHVVSTYDNPNVKIYVDGVDVGGLSNAPDHNIPARTLSIGSMTIAGSLSRFFDGEIGEVRVYDKALSLIEITQNYNATKARYE